MAYQAKIIHQAGDVLSRLYIDEADTTLVKGGLMLSAMEALNTTDTTIHFVDKISNVVKPVDQQTYL